ncbi:MAG: rhomboid family intramembrane serine protease [Gammaproteobacteria bacterium]
MDEFADAPATVFRTLDRRTCRDAALVLEALGLHPIVHELGDQWVIAVAPRDAAQARRELVAWQAENQSVRPESPPRQPVADGWPGVLAYVLVVVAVALAVSNFALGRDWLAAGGVDGAAMRAGEWWRAFTALTLHAGLEHMAANIFFGGVFGWFAGRYLGSGVAWLLILLAGASGNIINVAIMGEAHRSIGASTAVFAALGLLGSLGWAGRRHSAKGRIYRWGPIIAAVALLAYTGAGGERTDIGAHIWGFVAGLGVGLLAARMPPALLSQQRLQVVAGTAALAAIALVWVLALSAGT